MYSIVMYSFFFWNICITYFFGCELIIQKGYIIDHVYIYLTVHHGDLSIEDEEPADRNHGDITTLTPEEKAKYLEEFTYDKKYIEGIWTNLMKLLPFKVRGITKDGRFSIELSNNIWPANLAELQTTLLKLLLETTHLAPMILMFLIVVFVNMSDVAKVCTG